MSLTTQFHPPTSSEKKKWADLAYEEDEDAETQDDEDKKKEDLPPIQAYNARLLSLINSSKASLVEIRIKNCTSSIDSAQLQAVLPNYHIDNFDPKANSFTLPKEEALIFILSEKLTLVIPHLFLRPQKIGETEVKLIVFPVTRSKKPQFQQKNEVSTLPNSQYVYTIFKQKEDQRKREKKIQK